MNDTIAAVIGAALGLAIGTYVLVYVPMARNYADHGCVFLTCK